MKKYKRIGIDLAKNIIQVCAVDHNEKRVFNKALRRAEVMKFFSECEPCLIGIEACSSAHYWARALSKLGHTVKLIAPQKMKPYVTGHKNDMRDAETICEAISRPHMTLVPNQHSSGGKTRLGSITKRGDSYLRTLLVHCAKAVLRTIGNKTGRRADWINNMAIKKPFNVVAVALANKTARIVWAILNKGTDYRTDMGIRESSQLMG